MQIRSLMLAAALLGCGPVIAQPLTLEEALRLGETQSPRLSAQRSMVSAADAQLGRAGELPDPKLRLGIENLPVSGPDQFHYGRDFMTARTVGLVQEFPHAAKREARNLRAGRVRDVEGASLGAERAGLQRDVAAAWLDAHYAERTREALERLARQFELQIDAVRAGIARGRQSVAEGFALRHAYEQANDRVIEQERMVSRARIALAALIGDAARRPLGEPPETARLAHGQILQELARLPQLQVLDLREGLARAEVDLARASRRADWMLEVGYGHRRPFFDNMLTVMIAFDLPWQTERRQDRDIAARLAELEQARALREDARRRHDAELRGWLADHETAARRIERAERVLLPLARERRDAAAAAYQGARGELGAVLEAERAITETELGLLQALAQRAAAWANLNFVYPQEAAR